MRINLKKASTQNEKQSLVIEINDRLPEHLKSVCVINCTFNVEEFKNYFLIDLQTQANLSIRCQRCLSEFPYDYSNQSELAICNSDEIAEQMMDRYDCLVATNEIDLKELITDELNLYSPEFHPDHRDCDHEVDRFINPKKE